MASPTKVVVGTVVIAVIAMAIALILSSIEKLSTEQAGIMYDVHQRKLKDTVYTAGMHTGPPGFDFIVFPRVYKTASFDNVNCLNKDGLTIQLKVQFQYLVSLKAEELRSLILDFKDHETYMQVVQDAAQSVIHDVCSEFNITQFQTSRMQFQTRIKDTLSSRLKTEFFTTVGDVQVSNIERPAQYERIVREKELAQQNIEVAKQERPRIITQAQTKKKEAETQAEI
jgi:prohibitin 2